MADNNLQILLNSGFDAFSNLYDVEIIVPKKVSDASAELVTSYKIRAMDFKPPNLALGEYQSHYKVVDITRMNAMFTGEREFQLKMRVDANWDIYKYAKQWKNLYSNISKDTVNLGLLSSGTSADWYGTITVKAYEASNGLSETGSANSNLFWTFNQVMLYDVVEPNFSRSGSTAIDLTCNCLFGEYNVGTLVSDKPEGGV